MNSNCEIINLVNLLIRNSLFFLPCIKDKDQSLDKALDKRLQFLLARKYKLFTNLSKKKKKILIKCQNRKMLFFFLPYIHPHILNLSAYEKKKKKNRSSNTN